MEFDRNIRCFMEKAVLKEDKVNRFLNESKLITAMIFLMAAGFVVLNFIRIFDNSFWGDEAYSINLTRMGFGDMIKQVGIDVQAPFFYVLLKIFIMVLGNHGYVYHLVSFSAYLLLVCFLLFVVRKEYGNIATALMLIFSTLTTNSLIYMTEIRMYQWGCVLVFLSFYYSVRIMKSDDLKNWIIFSAVSLMAAYSQTYCLIAVAFLYAAIICIALFRKEYWKKCGDDVSIAQGKKFRMRTVAICAVAVAAYLPWLFVLFYQVGHAAEGWWQTQIPTVMELFVNHFDHGWMVVVLIMVVGAFVATIITSGTRSHREEMGTVIIGAISVLGTALVGLGMCYFIRPMFLDKYFYPLAGISYFLFAYMISKVRFGGIPAVIVAGLFLIIGAKNYKVEFSNARYIDAGTNAFIENLNFDSDTVVYANSDHYHWAILPCYYPDADIRNAEGAEFDFDGADGKDVYLVWTTEVGSKENMTFDERGETLNLVYTGNIGNHLPLWVYKAVK